MPTTLKKRRGKNSLRIFTFERKRGRKTVFKKKRSNRKSRKKPNVKSRVGLCLDTNGIERGVKVGTRQGGTDKG